MKKKPKVHLDSFEEYRTSVLHYLQWMLEQYYGDVAEIDINEIKKDQKEINVYENFSDLESVDDKNIIVFDDRKINTLRARQAIIKGRLLWEHTAAGEATRLGLGTKYLLDLSRFSPEQVAEHVREEAYREVQKKGLTEKNLKKEKEKILKEITLESVLGVMGEDPRNLMPISLGNRHMLQMVFDVIRVAQEMKENPLRVLSRQSAFIVLNEQTAEEILEEFKSYNFFGLNPENVFFMVQRSFHGIYIKEGVLFYDKTTEKNKRLHNHGQLVMQKNHDNVIFRVSPESVTKRNYISNKVFEKILKRHSDLISYNVEDLGYLTCAIDLPSLSLALELGEKGYSMVMEIVAQNSIKPQKGGACFYDKKKNRVVMIESNQLKDIKNEEIKHLNKNFNHYPNPAEAYRVSRKKGLPITFEVKEAFDQGGNSRDYIYACPVQGDMNFLLKTAYVMRKNLKPIYNWKSPATTPIAVEAMFAQESQEGFKVFAKKMKEGRLTF